MANQISYPVCTQSFEILRKEGYLYIDKTMFIKKLMNNARYTFLGRPRRFGKSLFMSTMEAYFRGKKELFEGLAIAETEKEWKVYPVIHLDLSKFVTNSEISLNRKIFLELSALADSYGISTGKYQEIDGFVSYLIEQLHRKTGELVVLLVDEYDVPLHGLEENSQEFKEKKETLRSLFLQFKASDAHVRMCFITGVARFDQVSLLSAPNNVDDISMNPRFATLCGFTHEELHKYCFPGIMEFAETLGIGYDEMREKLAEHYDGYRFTRDEARVFSPLSIMYALRDKNLGDYWVSTGLTSMFVKKLMEPGFQLPQITGEWFSESSLRKIFSAADPVSLMFQTGYLTIAEYDGYDYSLRIPNREVLQALTSDLIPAYMGKADSDENPLLAKLRRSIQTGKINEVIDVLKTIMSSIAHNLYPKEKDTHEYKENYFHTMTYLIFMMINSYTECEKPSNKGRSDMIAETDKYVYIFEFKVDKSVEEAFRQIEEKNYAGRYACSSKKVFKIAVIFSSAKHEITDWAYK